MTPGLYPDSRPGSLPARLDAANGYLGRRVGWQPMGPTGTTNRLYRGRLGARSLVLRLNADEDRAFGAVREAEAEVLAAIQGYDWAPHVLHNAWQEGWCLMADHGLPPDPQRGYDPSPALLSAVARWQRIDTGPAFNYPALFDRYRSVFGGHPAAAWIALVDQMTSVYRALPAVSACLTHHDLHGGNLCWDGQHLVVVDWEYAAIGNPWFDAGALHRAFGFAPDVIASLPAWQGMSVEDFGEGMVMARWLTEALGCLWYGVRTVGAADAEQWQQEAERLLTTP